jgi:hypothetical protein
MLYIYSMFLQQIIRVFLFGMLTASPLHAVISVSNISDASSSYNGTTNKTNPKSDMKLIINLGFAKTGTTTMKEFLDCIGVRGVTHWQCNRRDTCGVCFSIAKQNNISITKACGKDHVAYTEINEVQRCIFPQISHLQFLTTKHADARFILLYRDSQSWIKSARNYGSADLMFFRCYLRSGQPLSLQAREKLLGNASGTGTTRRRLTRELYDTVHGDRILMRWYERQYSLMRNFFAKRPSIAFFFSNLSRPTLEDDLREFLGRRTSPGQTLATTSAKKRCWGHANRNTKTQT